MIIEVSGRDSLSAKLEPASPFQETHPLSAATMRYLRQVMSG
jgi:hypothetical protein